MSAAGPSSFSSSQRATVSASSFHIFSGISNIMGSRFESDKILFASTIPMSFSRWYFAGCRAISISVWGSG